MLRSQGVRVRVQARVSVHVNVSLSVRYIDVMRSEHFEVNLEETVGEREGTVRVRVRFRVKVRVRVRSS